MCVWSVCLTILCLLNILTNVFSRIVPTEDEIQQITGRDGGVQQHEVIHDYMR